MAETDRIVEDAEGNLVVQYTLAGKLDSIMAGVTQIRTTLDSKADRSDMARVDSDLLALTMRVGVVESNQRDEKTAREAVANQEAQRFTRKEKMWGIGVGLTTVTGIWLGPILANIHHG